MIKFSYESEVAFVEFLSILKTKNKSAKNYFLALILWLSVSLMLGLVCGIVGSLFYHLISYANFLRTENGFLIYFLPIAGVLIVLLYRLLKIKGQNTNTIFLEIQNKNQFSPVLSFAVFVSSVITHLFGGSAGKEGAALQIGASFAKGIAKIFKLSFDAAKILIIAGLAGMFSAVFATPLTAAIFAVTVISVGKIYLSAVFQSLVASFSAYFVAKSLGVTALKQRVFVDGFSAITILKTLGLIVAATAVGIIFVKAMRFGSKLFKIICKNEYNRILFGAVLIVVLSFIFGTDYLGTGTKIIDGVFAGKITPNYAFILKILFTAITMAVGFKGGEIVPGFFVGATFGAFFGGILGLSITFSAAVCMVVMFCVSTKTPLASLILGIELFGFTLAPYFIIAVIISFLLSGKQSLYKEQEYLIAK